MKFCQNQTCGKPIKKLWRLSQQFCSKSCAKRWVKHRRLHNIWSSMKARCLNHNSPAFPRYGGRGIQVCQEWMDYRAFEAWALSQPNYQTHTLDRENNDGNYEPGNCRFATPLTQARNSRHNVLVEAFGESKCISEWAEDTRCQVSYYTLVRRLKHYRLPAEEAITRPPRRWTHSGLYSGSHA